MRYFGMFFLTFLIFFNYYTNVYAFVPKSFTADIIQVYKSAIKGKIKKSYGKIEYRQGGDIRFEIEKPDAFKFISNAKKTWYYTPPFMASGTGELTVRTTNKTTLSSFFDILKNGLKSNKNYNVKWNTSLIAVLKFSKIKTRALGIKMTSITFKDSTKNFTGIRDITIHYVKKSPVKLIFKNIKIGVKLDNSRFEFIPPSNTRIDQ